ncbi:hypothetical protein KIPB_013411, partial [Kipferlia bialata]
SIVAGISAMFIVETMGRVDEISRHADKSSPDRETESTHIGSPREGQEQFSIGSDSSDHAPLPVSAVPADVLGDEEEKPTATHMYGSTMDGPADDIESATSAEFCSIAKPREVTELAEFLWGAKGKLIFQIVLTIYMAGVMTGYVAVIVETLVRILPLPGLTSYDECDLEFSWNGDCEKAYMIYISIFTIIALPLCVKQLKEQIPLQVVLTTFRFLCITLMIGTVCYAMMHAPFDPLHSTDHPPYVFTPVKLADKSMFGQVSTPSVSRERV